MKYIVLSLAIGCFSASSAVFGEVVSNNLDSKMSSLNPLFEESGIEVRYPALLLFNEQGYLMKVVHNDKNSRYISQDLGEDLLLETRHPSGLRTMDLPSEIQTENDDSQSDLYLMVIDESMCEACAEERYKLKQWASDSDISVNVNTVVVEFK